MLPLPLPLELPLLLLPLLLEFVMLLLVLMLRGDDSTAISMGPATNDRRGEALNATAAAAEEEEVVEAADGELEEVAVTIADELIKGAAEAEVEFMLVLLEAGVGAAVDSLTFGRVRAVRVRVRPDVLV